MRKINVGCLVECCLSILVYVLLSLVPTQWAQDISGTSPDHRFHYKLRFRLSNRFNFG